MTPQQQIKALAELDGWEEFEYRIEDDQTTWYEIRWKCIDNKRDDIEYLPQYLTSYDAIILLCFKYWGDWFWKTMRNKATPPQLCEALLRVTGKWIE